MRSLAVVITILWLLDAARGATYFLTPADGDDGDSGLTPALAWRTAGKVNGFSFSNGDVLVINAPSNSPLDLSATNLTLSAHGLTVKGTNGYYWHARLWQTLTNSNFTLLHPNVYSIPVFNNAGFGQSNVVVWEDDKWMNRTNAATWAAASNYIVAVAGSFWTDGATIYVHPFGDTNPNSDGKAYTRSVARDETGFAHAINLNGTNIHLYDVYAGKTCMAERTTGDGLAAYVIGTMGNFSGGTDNVVSNCYLYYGSKHVIGFTSDADDQVLHVYDVQAEQASPYASASAFVSFMSGAAKRNNVHRYIRPRCDAPIGLIGSTAGQGTVQSVMLSHNTGSGVQYRELSFDGAMINGYVAFSVCTNAILMNSVVGGYQPNAVVSNLCVRNHFTGIGLDLTFNSAPQTLVQSNTALHTNQIVGGQWTGWLLKGTNVTMEFNTFDFRSIPPIFAVQDAGILKRQGDLVGFVFRNNVVMNMTTNNFSVFHAFSSVDSMAISNNVYSLGYSNFVAAFYTNSGVEAYRTFGQWQSLGFDLTSETNANVRLVRDYRPLGDSPVRGAATGGGDVGAVPFTPFMEIRGGFALDGRIGAQ